ncbi:MAG: hypothetical protein A3J76_00835 [Candidatus Moranbacteria bacterium RBG_13_45_13]|nr:MAG: hypothetical protein A3J76_00835 [Candidatus Moranbacteria bacterium RBG_13_45_13]
MSFIQFLGEYYRAIVNAFSTSWWFVFPIAFFYVFKELYWRYVWIEYNKTLKWTLLEIKPPRDIERSPRTMEQIFIVLHGIWSTPSYFDMYFKGRMFQSIFSFEIRGVNGEMHFYIRTETRYRNLVEAAIYSQYPEAEIEEVEDYILGVPVNIPNPEWNLWGTDFKLTKDDAYPIRTYHKFQEEVTKGMIEPLGPLADAISTLPPGHEIWLQILIRPIKEKEWEPAVKKVVAKLAGREIKKESLAIASFFSEAIDILASSVQYIFGLVPEKKEEKKEEQPLQFRLTPVEKDVLQAVEESLNKKAFKTKLRLLYIAPRETFQKVFYQAGDGFTHQFNDPNLNTLAKDNETKTYANYWFRKYRMTWAQRKIFRRYITRDNDGPNMFLNTEELATIWHLPDMSAMSPAIARIEAKKSGAPLNLPVG